MKMAGALNIHMLDCLSVRMSHQQHPLSKSNNFDQSVMKLGLIVKHQIQQQDILKCDVQDKMYTIEFIPICISIYKIRFLQDIFKKDNGPYRTCLHELLPFTNE